MSVLTSDPLSTQFRHSSFGFLSSFVIRHSLFLCACLLAGCASSNSSHQAPGAGLRRAGADGDAKRLAEAHAHYSAGVLHELNDEKDKALNEYYQAVLKDPDNEALLLEVSQRLAQNKQYDKAITVLTNATSRPTASAPVFIRLSFIYLQLGKYDLAAAASRGAIKKSPSALGPYQNLVTAYLQQKRPSDAIHALDEAAALPTRAPERLVALAELYSGIGLQFPKQRKEAEARALTQLDRASKLPIPNLQVRLALADHYGSLGKTAKAADIYRDELSKSPEPPALKTELRQKLVALYLRDNDHKHAIEQIEAVLRDDPTNPQAYYTLGAIMYEDKKLAEAAENFSHAILLRPGLEQAYYQLASTQIAQSKTSDALATLADARRRFPQNFLLEYLAGTAFSQQKAYSEAVQHYTAAEVVATATHPEWLDKFFYFHYGAAYERKGELEEAEKHFKKCLKLAPDFAEALNYLGYMWAEHGQHLKESRTMIEKALKLEPKNAAYLDSMAWVLFKQGHVQPALGYILRAVALTEPPDATVFDHLGDIYAAMGQPAKAKQAWEKSLALEASDGVKKKLANNP